MAESLWGRVTRIWDEAQRGWQIWLALSGALVTVTGVVWRLRDWFFAAPVVLQFTFAAGVLVGVGAILWFGTQWAVVRLTQQLAVVISGFAECRATMSDYEYGIIWLHRLTLTKQKPGTVSAEMRGAWRTSDGREATSPGVLASKDGFKRGVEVTLTDTSPMFEHDDIRFFLHRDTAFERGISKAEALSAQALVLVRDRITGRQRYFPVQNRQRFGPDEKAPLAQPELVELLNDYSRSLDHDSASPANGLALAKEDFEMLAAKARAGDQRAARKLPGAGKALRDASRAYNTSGVGFHTDLAHIKQVIDEIAKLNT